MVISMYDWEYFVVQREAGRRCGKSIRDERRSHAQPPCLPASPNKLAAGKSASALVRATHFSPAIYSDGPSRGPGLATDEDSPGREKLIRHIVLCPPNHRAPLSERLLSPSVSSLSALWLRDGSDNLAGTTDARTSVTCPAPQ